MSPAWAKWTTEAGWPATTARLWSPEAPKELLKLTPSPADVFWNAGSRSSWYTDSGVEYPTTSSFAPPDEPPLSLPPPHPATTAARTNTTSTSRGAPLPLRGRAASRAFRMYRILSLLTDLVRRRPGTLA